MGTSLSKYVLDTFGKSASIWGVWTRRKNHSELLERLRDSCICILPDTIHRNSAFLWALVPEGTPEELSRRHCWSATPQQIQNNTHTYLLPSCICMLCPKVPGEVDKWEIHRHQGLDRVHVEYSRGFFRRLLPEVHTGATRIIKYMGMV